jgi:hypothetical protein
VRACGAGAPSGWAEKASADRRSRLGRHLVLHAGILACIDWAGLLDGHRKLNGAKFKVLQDIERCLPRQPFSDEQLRYKEAGRKPLTRIEIRVPWSFAALYIILLLAAALL